MDRFITRIPKTPQNAVTNQIRAVPEVSSKQASAEKISHEFMKKYFLKYKWLQKMKEIYFARPAHFLRMNEMCGLPAPLELDDLHKRVQA